MPLLTCGLHTRRGPAVKLAERLGEFLLIVMRLPRLSLPFQDLLRKSAALLPSHKPAVLAAIYRYTICVRGTRSFKKEKHVRARPARSPFSSTFRNGKYFSVDAKTIWRIARVCCASGWFEIGKLSDTKGKRARATRKSSFILRLRADRPPVVSPVQIAKPPTVPSPTPNPRSGPFISVDLEKFHPRSALVILPRSYSSR